MPGTASPPDNGAEQRDGRSLRRERTREAIVDAVLSLLQDGELRPTAEQIAGRAAVSERSVFQHFPERDGLLLAVGERQRERVMAVVRRIPDDLPFEERLDLFVAQRARVWEIVTPVRRAAILHEPFSEPVHEGLQEFRRLLRSELERVFGPELGRRRGAERDATVAAAAAIAEWPAWETLRAQQGLSSGKAAAAVRRALAALLAQ